MDKIKTEIIQKVWEKATAVPDVDSNLWRKDIAGAWISRKHFGNECSEYGWQIDHIVPQSKIAFLDYENFDNLQPLQWNNKLAKADNYPVYSTTMTADIANNIKKTQYWRYNVTTVRRKKLEEVVALSNTYNFLPA